MLRYIGYALLFTAFLFAAGLTKGHAEAPTPGAVLVHKERGATYRLYDKPCDAPAMKAVVVPEKIRELKAADGDFGYVGGGRRTLLGCWRFFPKNKHHGDVYGLIYQDGDIFQFGADAFVRDGV